VIADGAPISGRIIAFGESARSEARRFERDETFIEKCMSELRQELRVVDAEIERLKGLPLRPAAI
jgi:hypothetical protein